MDTFAALALATNPVSEEPLECKPNEKNVLLFSVYKILMQSIYQIIAIFMFHFCGIVILESEHTMQNELIVKTFVLATFVFAKYSTWSIAVTLMATSRYPQH